MHYEEEPHTNPGTVKTGFVSRSGALQALFTFPFHSLSVHARLLSYLACIAHNHLRRLLFRLFCQLLHEQQQLLGFGDEQFEQMLWRMNATGAAHNLRSWSNATVYDGAWKLLRCFFVVLF